MILFALLQLDGKSVMHDTTMTALPGTMKPDILWDIKAFLGDYYKTYGLNNDSIQEQVFVKI